MNIIEAREANKTQAVISPIGSLWSVGEMQKSEEGDVLWRNSHVFGEWKLAPPKPKVWDFEWTPFSGANPDWPTELMEYNIVAGKKFKVHLEEIL